MKGFFSTLPHWLQIAVPLMLVSPLLTAQPAGQSSDQPSEHTPSSLIEELTVTGGREQISKLAGSASLLDEEQILAFDSTDINSLLNQVPGVYIRQEDGYGLRPNIGLRGATSERSQKITLMEDGILIAPAPYSAPAAYYLPNVNRMAMVEVFKGPASIQYGPHTVGGALNLVTTIIPEDEEGKAELTLGDDGYQKYRVVYGESVGQWGYVFDALRYSSNGFKELDSGGDTGFVRNDLNGKIRWQSDADAAIEQELQLKLGYADEESSETYLGISDADFYANPERRYIASELDKFESEHVQAHLIHFADFGNSWTLTSKLYHNQYDRTWFKFDGFIDNDEGDNYGDYAPVSTVLANPESYGRVMSLLRGEVDSNGSDLETIDVADFDRSYGSSGAEFRTKYTFDSGEFDHQIEAGLRYHYDYVERDHLSYGYLVQSGGLVSDGVERSQSTLNKDETDAVAVFFSDSIEYQDLKVDLGLRYEYIEGVSNNKLTNTSSNNDQAVLLPGLGVYYQMTDEIGFLAGVNKGFSPASPGAGDDVDPEESISYEYGLRYQSDNLQADVIAFFSDYDNLLGRCRVSDTGCTVGDEFNGGKIEIGGVEVTGAYTADLPRGLLLPINLVYTFTESAFQETFVSSFSQWNPDYFDGEQGTVVKGDELPYLPEHQARLQVGLAALSWRVDAAIKYTGKMREVPDRGSYEEGEYLDDYTTLDLTFTHDFGDDLTLKFIVENATDERVIVSRRPFGARPNLSRLMKVGASYNF